MKSKILFTIFFLASASGFAQTPAHFFNDEKNLNKTPGYTPGDYPMPEAFKARTLFQAKKQELITGDKAASSNQAVTLGLGEVYYTSLKNKTAEVLGYFRSYVGVAEFDGRKPKLMKMLIDINSMDTAVPGRNNRILAIFFESMKPKNGLAVVRLDKFKAKGKGYSASGAIALNGRSQPINAQLSVQKKNNTWVVETTKPISLLLSEFNFGNRIYDLMKECNHKSIGNKVDITAKVYLR